MDVILRDMATDDLDVVGITDFSDEITGSSANATRKYRFMVLCSPDQVIFAIEDSMRCFAVEFHLGSLAS